MPRHSIDIGIDLGTTNSAIAVMQQGTPFIVPDNDSLPLTPSVVRVSATGALTIGRKAADRMVADPDNTVGGFKRWMGTNQRKHFVDAGIEMSAPQLSAEVLKLLRGNAQQMLGEAITAAVITVPAAFDLTQCAATQEAAQLAGIEQAPLLQEPIAASLAYGYRLDMEGQHWLVYDLGGGTFDLALVGVRDGRVQVLDHEGDNFLGGTDFDWLIVEHILLPRLAGRFNVASFRRENGERRAALAVLKRAGELAKIELSRSDSTTATVETLGTPMLDDNGIEIEADISFTREEYEAVIATQVERTVTLSRMVLQRNPAISIESVLMAGGPTLTPAIRRAVGDGLGVRVNTSANPLTVVAEGAALYAATQPVQMRTAVAATPGAVALQLTHKTVTDDDSAPVGCLVPPPVAALEFVASDASWSSGQLPVASGRVMVRVPLPHRGAHEFRLIARNDYGTIIPAIPSSLTITRGLTAAAAPLSRSLGVVVDDGSGEFQVDVLIPKGSPLPARGTMEYRTMVSLEPGGEIEIIQVHVVEGESSRPERNRKVGDVVITDRHVSRRVPAGNPIEVTTEVDESRRLSAKAYLPLIDQTFHAELTLSADEPDATALNDRVRDERERVATLAEHVPAARTRELHEELRNVEAEVFASAGSDPDTAQRALRNLQRVQMEIDALEDTQRLPRAVVSAREEAELATSVVMDSGDEGQRARLHALAQDLDRAIATGSVSEIRRVEAKLGRLRFEVLASQPTFWVAVFNHMCETAHGWTDHTQADVLIRQGRRQIMQEDFDGLRGTFFELRRLLPPDEAARLGRFQNVGIRR